MSDRDIFDRPLADIKAPDWLDIVSDTQPTQARSTSRASAPSGLRMINQLMQMERREQTEANRVQRETAKQQKADAKALEQAIAEDPTMGTPSWIETRDADPSFSTLPFSEKRKRYDDYVNAVVTRATSLNPKVSEDDVRLTTQDKQPFAEEEPSRAWWEMFTDPALGVAAGVTQFASSIPAAINPGSETAQSLGNAADFIRSGTSDVAEDARRQEQFENEQFREQNPDAGMLSTIANDAGSAIRNLSLASVGELVGQIVPSLLPVGAAARGAQALGAGAGAARAAGLVAGGATGAVSTAGDLGQNAYDAVKDAAFSDLDQDLRTQALRDNNNDEEAAHEALAQAASISPRIYGALIGTVSAFTPAERAIARVASGSATRGGLGRVAASTAIEAGSEAAEEGGGQLLSNVEAQDYVPGLDVSQGVGQGVALGALGGTGAGAVGGVLESRQAARNAATDDSAPPPAEGTPPGGEGGAVTDIPGYGQNQPADGPIDPDTGVGTDQDPNALPDADLDVWRERYPGDLDADLDAAAGGSQTAVSALRTAGITDVTQTLLNTQRLLSRRRSATTPTEPTTEPEAGPATEPETPPTTEPDLTPTEPAAQPPVETPTEPTTDRLAAARQAALPPELSRIAPRFGARAVSFNSDLERAAYVIANGATRSARDADIVRFVRAALGDVDENAARTFGTQVRDAIKAGARATSNGPVTYNPVDFDFAPVQPGATQGAQATGLGQIEVPQVTPESGYSVVKPNGKSFDDNVVDAIIKKRNLSPSQRTQVEQRVAAANAEAQSLLSIIDDPQTSALDRAEASRQARQLSTYMVNPKSSSLGMTQLDAERVFRQSRRVDSPVGQLLERFSIGRTPAPSARYGRAIRATENQGALLRAAARAEDIGTANAETLNRTLDLFELAGIDLPAIEGGARLPATDTTFVMGRYHSNSHRIELASNASPSTLNHELLHALTERGFVRMRERNASSGAYQANIDLLKAIHQQLEAATQGRRYGASRNRKTNAPLLSELFAELSNPDFANFANEVPFQVPNDPQVRNLYNALKSGQDNMSLLETFARLITNAIRNVLPIGFKGRITPDSVLDILTRTAVDMMDATSAYTNTANMAPLPNPPVFSQPGVRQRDVTSQMIADKYDANFIGEEPSVDSTESSERGNTAQTINDIRNNVAAKPSTFRGAVKAAYEAAKKAPANQSKVSAFFQAMNNGGMSHLNMLFHNHKEPFINWVNGLPDAITAFRKQSLKGALENAPGIRDYHLGDFMSKGGTQISQQLAAISNANPNMSPETIKLRVGQWLTAVRAPGANAKLLTKDIKNIDDLSRQYSDAVTAMNNEPDPFEQSRMQKGVDNLRVQLREAAKKLSNRQKAVSNPDITTETHAAGVAGGMSNAMAAEVRRAVEALIPKAQLEKVAKATYDLNAAILAVDIESGRSNPNVVARFLERPDLESLFVQLVDARRNADASVPASIDALNDLRNRVRDAVRSDYVPMSGNPRIGIDADLFHSDTSIPNTGALHEMDGRQTSIADDGLTATWNRAIKSATFAGYYEFGKQLNLSYKEMGKKLAAENGLVRDTPENPNTSPRDGVIFRESQGTTHVFRFVDNPGIFEALKGNNVKDTAQLFSLIAKPTQFMAYFMTQANPFFAPKNAFRDALERSENLRFRDYARPDGQLYTQAERDAAARRMLKLYADPDLYASSQKHAWGKKNRNTYLARMLREMEELGGVSVFGDRFARDNTSFIKNVLREKSTSRRAFSKLKGFTDSYNRGFDIMSSVSSYTALREMGMDAQTAARETLDLMNFRKTGTAMPAIRAMYVFAQPAVTGGANIISSVYDRKTGRLRPRALARYGAYTLMLTAIQGAFRALAEDDEGGNTRDQLGSFTLSNNIPVPVPGTDAYFLIPTPYGASRIASGLANALVETFAGEKTMGASVGNFVGGSLLPAITPFEYTNIDLSKRAPLAIAMGIAPTWAKPILGLAANRTPFDTPIVNDNYEKRDQYRYEQFGGKVAPMYKDIAKFMHDWTGADMSPEEVRFVFQQYGQGIFKMAGNSLIEDPYKDSVGKNELPALLKTFFARPNPNVANVQFYQNLEEAYSAQRKLAAGETLVGDDRKYVDWLLRWERTDKELRNQRAKVTRDKTLGAEAKDRRYQFIQEKRDIAQRRALYNIRTALGKSAEWTGSTK